MELSSIQKEVGANAREHGFWKAHERVHPTVAACYIKLGLITTEVAEATEALRDGIDHGSKVQGQMMWQITVDTGKPEGFGSELADIVIRVLDLADYAGLSLSSVLAAKTAYNRSRPHMHGKQS